MKKTILSILAVIVACLSLSAQPKDYKATVFGAKTDGITDNTGSIQRAVDFISEHGGGNLWFYVGRYVTGAIELKDNVHIIIAEGAVLVAPTNYYKYKGADALIWAEGRKNVAVTGIPTKPDRGGVIETDREGLDKFIASQVEKGNLPENIKRPSVFSFKDCDGVTIGDLKLISPVDELPYIFTNCSDAHISGFYIHGTYQGNGIILTPEGKTIKLAK